MSSGIKISEKIKRRYNLIAPLYDFIMNILERRGVRGWRKLLWSKTGGSKILEVGVGTGKNIPFYPADCDITAIDFSEKMLAIARGRANQLGVKVKMELADVQNLAFADNSFDTVAATWVFCTVPDPIKGLKEVARVCKPGGKVVLLEHVLSPNPFVGFFMNIFSSPLSWLIGDSNRKTVENVKQSGLAVERVTNLGMNVFLLIEARKN